MQLAAHPSGSLGRIASPSHFRLHRPNRTPCRRTPCRTNRPLLVGGPPAGGATTVSVGRRAHRARGAQRLEGAARPLHDGGGRDALVGEALRRQV